MSSNVSYDLIWQISRPYSKYLVKRRNAGGIQFSQEPLNVVNRYQRYASGFANPSAVGVVSSPKGIKLLRKSSKAPNQPAKTYSETTFKADKDARKIVAAVSKATQKRRDDLVEAAVLKASALARARKTKKAYPRVRR